MNAIGIDIGGTKVAAGVVNEAGEGLAGGRRRTPSKDPEHLVDVVSEIVRQLLSEHDVGAVGVGAAGFVDGDRRNVLFSPNLAWLGTPPGEQICSSGVMPELPVDNGNTAAGGE